MKNGKENSTRSAFSCTEVSGGNRGGSAGRDGFAGYFESKFRSLCWDGCKYDRGSEKYHCGGSGTVSVSDDQSGDHKERWCISDGGRVPFAGWGASMHQISGNRSGLSGSEF